MYVPSRQHSIVKILTASLLQCGQLAKVLGSKVSFPGNSAYETSQDSYFSLQEAALSPACVIVPSSPQDVADAVTIISGIPSCQFAIKGQTHAPAAGFANVNAGVTIDMTPLSSVEINDDKTVASIGGGASWLDVYTYLDSFGLSVAGGRNGAVGVGGKSWCRSLFSPYRCFPARRVIQIVQLV